MANHLASIGIVMLDVLVLESGLHGGLLRSLPGKKLVSKLLDLQSFNFFQGKHLG